MTFLSICQGVYRKVGFRDAPESDVQARVKQTVNIWHRRLISRPGFQVLRNAPPITFATVANQANYAMPQALARINNIVDRTTPITFERRSLEWQRDRDPQMTTISQPWTWAEIGWRQVAADPVTTGVWVASSAAGDTTQTAYIEGVRANSTRSGPISVTLTGTTRVQLGTFTDYTELDKAFISAASVGTVTFYDAAVSGNALATISIGKTSAKHLWITLWPVPAGVITNYVDYERQIEDMVQDSDEPLLPEDFQNLLIDAGAMEEWLRKNDSRGKDEKSLLDEQIRKLQHFVLNPPQYQPVIARQSRGRASLGGQYPADRWNG